MILFTDIFETTKPVTNSELVFSELDPISSDMAYSIFADDSEFVYPALWGETTYFEDIDPSVTYTASPIYAEDFLWGTSISNYLMYTYTPEPSDVAWGDTAIYFDGEEWPPYMYAQLLDGVLVVVVPWVSLFTEIETVLPLWGFLYGDNTEEDFPPWHPVRPELSGYLPHTLFSNRILLDSYEAPVFGSYLIYEENTAINPEWSSVYLDTDEWIDVVWETTTAYQDAFEWVGDRTITSIFVDHFLYVRPVTTDTFLFSDAFGWNVDFLGWQLLTTDNMENDFPPYIYLPTENGYLPADIWRHAFTDTYEVFSTVEWEASPYYVDNFNVTAIAFSTTAYYRDGYENLPLLQYGLTLTYLFELVIWSDVTYIENWEWMDLIEYFDPFTEDFEWAPTVSYVEPPDLAEDFELNKVWECFFSDSFES